MCYLTASDLSIFILRSGNEVSGESGRFIFPGQSNHPSVTLILGENGESKRDGKRG